MSRFSGAAVPDDGPSGNLHWSYSRYREDPNHVVQIRGDPSTGVRIRPPPQSRMSLNASSLAGMLTGASRCQVNLKPIAFSMAPPKAEVAAQASLSIAQVGRLVSSAHASPLCFVFRKPNLKSSKRFGIVGKRCRFPGRITRWTMLHLA